MRDDIPTGAKPWIGWTLAVLTLLLILVGWVVVRGMGAGDALEQAGRSNASLQQAIIDDDSRRIELFATRVIDQTGSARSLTSDPIWRVGEFVPGVGSGMRALREVSAAAADFTAETVPHLLRADEEVSLGSLGWGDSTFEAAGLNAAGIHLGRAAAAAETIAERLDAIDVAAAGGPLAEDARAGHRALVRAVTRVQALSATAQLLPLMLGDDEPRAYLIAAAGGTALGDDSIRSLTHITVTDGVVAYERTLRSLTLPSLAEQPLPSGSFAAHAALIAAEWEEKHEDAIDGVVMIDLETLRLVLGVVGDVHANDRDYSAENIVQALTEGIAPTEEADEDEQSTLFARAVGAAVNKALDAPRPGALFTRLADAVEGGHLVLWSAHPPEQSRLEASALGDY